MTVNVLEYEKVLITASDLCGELDSLVALAIGARKYRLAPPKKTTANIIRIEGGRHPLQELTVPSYIPNDCTLAGGIGVEEDDEPLPPSLSSNLVQESVESASTLIMTGTLGFVAFFAFCSRRFTLHETMISCVFTY